MHSLFINFLPSVSSPSLEAHLHTYSSVGATWPRLATSPLRLMRRGTEGRNLSAFLRGIKINPRCVKSRGVSTSPNSDKVMVLRKRMQPPDCPLDKAKCQQGRGRKDGAWCMGDNIFCWGTRTFSVFGILIFIRISLFLKHQ